MFLKIFIPAFAAVALLFFGIDYMLQSNKKKARPKAKPKAYSHFKTPAKGNSSEPLAYQRKTGSYFAPAGNHDSRNKISGGALPHFSFAGSELLPRQLKGLLQSRVCGILVDLNSRRVIWHHNAKKAVAVASLTKMMTSLLIMEKMEQDPAFNMRTRVTIDRAATSVERSCVLGARKGEVYTVDELMSAMIINSHNDAAAQLAAAAAGSVDDFVAGMNRRAAELDLTHRRFNSPNGLPQGRSRQNSISCSYDMVRICEYLMRYPEVMKLCVTRSKRLHTGKMVYSHNNLLRRSPVYGLIGFKTGFTNAAGCCLIFGVTRNGRTLIGCVTGFDRTVNRDRFCRQLIEWGFRQK